MPEYRYSRDHIWVSLQDGKVRVGISELAQAELGEVTFIELPLVGMQVKKDMPVCAMDSLKSSSEVYAPVSGTIAEVNLRLREEAGLINRDPLGEGWLFVLEMESSSEYGALMSGEEYARYIEGI
jgi:glycine cleavage system H protein